MDKGGKQGLLDAIDDGEFCSRLVEVKKRQQLNGLLEWHSLLLDDLLLPILAYLDVKILIEKKQVSCSWRVNCMAAIDAKRTTMSRKTFSTMKYCGFIKGTYS
jgi:phosphoserine aminotransferase